MSTTSLFISCVSNEFGNYRDAIRHDLSRPNLDIKIQEDFIAFGGATLEKLDEYIQHCEAVIHICGDMTGSMANQLSVQYINNHYKDFGKRFPALQPVLDGIDNLSYTQWEAWLAVYHGKRLFIAAPTAAASRDKNYINDSLQAVAQQEHLKQLRSQGYYPEIIFNDEDELIKKLYTSKLAEIFIKLPGNKPGNLPYQSIGSSFKGRREDVKELFDIFSATTNRVSAIALYGLGGLGKTRLAVEYALEYEKNYSALLFVHAGVPELLKNNIASLAAQGILDLPEHAALDESIKYAAVISWLNEHKGWLLILDNADTPEAAAKVEEVFASLQQGHVLITTRIDRWSIQIKKKPLGLLKPDAAIDFLLETTDIGREKRDDDPKVAATVAKDLGYLALALEQARAYIITKELSLEGYRKRWEANRAEVLKWFDPQQMQYPASVAITWQTSFDQLSTSTITLLNRLSWLAPDPIPKSLLTVEVPDAESIDAESAWAELKLFSLAVSSEDKRSFSVHRLVQDITRNCMDEKMAEQSLKESINCVKEAFTGDPSDVRDWPILEPLVPHALSLFEQASTKEAEKKLSWLMNQLGVFFMTKAQFALAEPLYRRALTIDEAEFGSNDPLVAVDFNNLAQLLQDLNRLDDAEPLMRKALAIDEDIFGENHPKVALRLNNLAALLNIDKRFPEAEPLMRRALAIDVANFGPDDTRVAVDLNNLAQLLKDTNREGEAEPLMITTLEIDEASFGTNHPAVARDLNNLAQLLQDTNRLEEAEPLMRRALAIDEASFGVNHPAVARDLNNLASLLKVINRLEEAEPLMKRSLIIFYKSLGNNHPSTETVGDNYRILLQQMGKTEEDIRNIFENLFQ